MRRDTELQCGTKAKKEIRKNIKGWLDINWINNKTYDKFKWFGKIGWLYMQRVWLDNKKRGRGGES